MIDPTPRPQWHYSAACRRPENRHLDWFGANDELDEAVAVCGICPVRDECLAFALEYRIGHGVWGGLTERQRRRLARRSAA